MQVSVGVWVDVIGFGWVWGEEVVKVVPDFQGKTD